MFWVHLEISLILQENEAEELTMKIDNLKKTEKERIKKIRAYEADLERMEAELKKPVQVEREEDVQAEIVRRLTIFASSTADGIIAETTQP